MVNGNIYRIFRNGSKTYFSSSLLFPKHIKQDVFYLYAFVRTLDNYVDQIPANEEGFEKFVNEYYASLKRKKSGNEIIHSFIDLKLRVGIEDKWVDAFIDAMRQDLTKKKYKNMNELGKYMYGSAEVVGLMMAKIMKLPEESYHSAKLLGRSMQYINFIRDIKEDIELGRQYIPTDVLKKHSLSSLSYDVALKNKRHFRQMVRAQVKHYNQLVRESEKGFSYIPYRYRIAIKTASGLYGWTAKKIYQNPEIVFEKKVKPGYITIIRYCLKSLIP